jgi:hypothetical protein
MQPCNHETVKPCNHVTMNPMAKEKMKPDTEAFVIAFAVVLFTTLLFGVALLLDLTK